MDASTVSINLQVNSVDKQLHQTVINILQTVTNRPTNGLQQAVRAIDDPLATTMHARMCAVNRSPGTSPGSLISRRDVFFDLPMLADLAR
eukprot:8959300-Ditylum_brightwellii.AAC.1